MATSSRRATSRRARGLPPLHAAPTPRRRLGLGLGLANSNLSLTLALALALSPNPNPAQAALAIQEGYRGLLGRRAAQWGARPPMPPLAIDRTMPLVSVRLHVPGPLAGVESRGWAALCDGFAKAVDLLHTPVAKPEGWRLPGPAVFAELCETISLDGGDLATYFSQWLRSSGPSENSASYHEAK